MTVQLYRVQIRVGRLARWAGPLPREVGGAIIAEAVQELIAGDPDGIKSLPFVASVDARRKHRSKTPNGTEGRP